MTTSRVAVSVWLPLLLTAGAFSAGCGDLRKRPLVSPQDGGSLDAPVDQFMPDGSNGDLVLSDAPSESSTGCVAGGACLPTNPCHEGEIVCMPDGGTSCTDTGRPQANGTVCGTNRVCREGQCGDCAAGSDCAITGRPCRVGTVSCSTGETVCTESDNRPNGTSCGAGMVCQAGACVACQDDATCTPANPCHAGTLDCSSGSAVCMDRGTNLPPGTSCGQNMVCNAQGACAACTAGATCPIPGRPCRTGTTACNTGAATCVESGNAPDGTSCGMNMVCSGGSCVGCTAGLSCVPTSNPCRTGMTACVPSPSCMMTGNAVPNGTNCGVDRVCNAGTCSACVSGAACQPANVCKLGATSCATGSSVCAETANVPNGTPCGTNLVCMSGTCSACNAGSTCTPTNPCRRGTLSCSTGTAICTDTGQSVADGTVCGTNQVCRTGQCVACTAGGACQPANPCKYGTISCATGTAVCVESGNKPVGTACGAAQSCTDGVRRSAEMCTANQTCAAMMMNCSTGACNAAGTDCAACAPGETACPNLGCRNLSNDPASCGNCGNRCSDPPVVGSGSPVCSNGTCDVTCNPGFVRCGGTEYCEHRVWSFEDGTTGGFGILRTDFPMAVRSISASTAQSRTGKYSLALAITARGESRAFEIGLKMCGSRGYVPGARQIVSAWFYLEPSGIFLPGTPALPAGSRFGEQLYTEARSGGNMLTSSEVRTWFFVSTAVEDLGTQLWQLAVAGVFGSDTSVRSDWEGTVYVDDIQISSGSIIEPPPPPLAR